MPWRLNPKNHKEVQKKVGKRWVRHALCKSVANAKRLLQFLKIHFPK